MKQEISQHLDEAYKHLSEALNLSVRAVQDDKSMERPTAALWEQFLGNFFRNVRMKGKEDRLNLMSIVSFSKVLRK